MDFYKTDQIITAPLGGRKIPGCTTNDQGTNTFKVAEWHHSPCKRLLDVIVSSTLIVLVLSWLWVLVSILIKLESRGPFLFRQRRVGKNGSRFTCYKFRTMYLNDASDARPAALADERITYVGNFLRRTHIDELPQLVNVLRGEMSLVGPRPHMVRDDEFFAALCSDYTLRQLVKPGVTGAAQVKGFHGMAQTPASIAARTRMDLFYVRKASFVYDLRILLATIVAPFFKASSYGRNNS